LPYLLYRAQTRYEDDLRGLQDITVRGVLSPLSTQPTNKPSEAFPFPLERPLVEHRSSSRMTGSIHGMSASTKLSTPLGVRARLSSLGHSPARFPKKASSSSTLTLQGPIKRKSITQLRPTTPSSSEGTDSEDEEAAKEEDADRKLEEQESLDKKLKNLQRLITGDALGLISSPRPKAKGKEVDRGRMPIPSAEAMQRSYRGDELSSRSQSVSSASSPRGSIPSLPSPPPESQSRSPISRHFSSSKSSSPPAISPRSARGQSNMRYGAMVGRPNASEQGSSHGSLASSFSDISDTSLSASALENALLSDIRGGTLGGGGSRLSVFTRSRFVGRGGVRR
jgi:hypothetical protein